MKSLCGSQIKLLVLDVLKPRTPSLPAFASFLGELEGVTKVDVSLVEMNVRTESLKVVLQGIGINFNALKEHMARQGAIIHSVDRIIVE